MTDKNPRPSTPSLENAARLADTYGDTRTGGIVRKINPQRPTLSLPGATQQLSAILSYRSHTSLKLVCGEWTSAVEKKNLMVGSRVRRARDKPGSLLNP